MGGRVAKRVRGPGCPTAGPLTTGAPRATETITEGNMRRIAIGIAWAVGLGRSPSRRYTVPASARVSG